MVRIKAKRGNKFGYLGKMYVLKEGEERDIDVPIEVIDQNSNEILSKGEEKNKKVKKEKKAIEE